MGALMLWLALTLPRFSLDRLSLGSTDVPVAVADRSGRRQVVVHASEAALQAGVHPGQGVPAAQALCGRLVVRRRDVEGDRRALEALAFTMLAFSPLVSVDSAPALLLEIAGSIAYFGGLSVLIDKARHALLQAGYAVQVGCAPTPLAALGRARAGRPQPVLSTDVLPDALADLPLDALPLSEEARGGLARLGIFGWRALHALPRAGVARRFGAQTLELLDKAYGRIPDLRTGVEIPPTFRQKVELSWDVESADALQFVGRRLLDAMAGFLAHRQLAVQQPRFELIHREGEPTPLVLGLARPTAHPREMFRILVERLGATRLTAPVRAVVLDAGPLSPATDTARDLFRQNPSTEDVPWMLARLQARWGESTVLGVATADEHRPERAWRRVPPGTPSPPVPVGARPLWLVDPPQLVAWDEDSFSSEFRLITRPERIETGWWDGAPIARDYFVAESLGGRRAWVFQDRKNQRWYIQGWFA
jgi:protein ImuB